MSLPEEDVTFLDAYESAWAEWQDEDQQLWDATASDGLK